MRVQIVVIIIEHNSNIPTMNNQYEIEERNDYVYLIHPENFEKQKIPIYKLGKTYRLHDRLNTYPKNSVIYLVQIGRAHV